MPDLTSRSAQIEIMDDLEASGKIIDVTLSELETINLLLGGNYVTINGINKLLNGKQLSHVSVADVGCGSGDILKLMRKYFNRKRISATLTGIDANPNIVAYARANTLAADNIQYEAVNIFSPEFKTRKFDILTGTLFFHHFSNEELIDFFRNLKSQLTIGFVINDIHRHWFAYHSIKVLTRIFSKSTMVKHDAPVSVMRAFRKNELQEILRQAGIQHYSLRWMWAFRWQVVIDLTKS
jgi:2-polyprenyl-3-methyl-5-hydroxy-6-metoxy-1,4-benzoquinol methylase